MYKKVSGKSTKNEQVKEKVHTNSKAPKRTDVECNFDVDKYDKQSERAKVGRL